MSNIDSHSLVASKENIQPLRRGRDTSQLCAALQAETDSETHQTLEKQRNEFEIRLRSQTSEDPLAAWCDYISWIEQSFPKQPREGKLNIVLQKCLNKFKDSERYMNDSRFVKLCIKYADLEENTVELFSQIHRHGIGVQCAELYIAWAERFALLDCFKKANVVYEKGLQCRAQPFEVLEDAHKRFLASLALRMLNKNEPQSTETISQPTESRQPYNVLTSISAGRKEVVPSIRIGGNVLGEPGKLKQSVAKDTKPKSNSGITIYQDSENDVVSAEPKAKLEKIQSKKALTKENSVKAGAWTDKSKKNVPFNLPAPVSVPFQVHVDEDNSESTPRHQPVASTVLKSLKIKKGYEDENYANAPLFYLEPYDPTKKPMYCKDMVYAGGLEFQFEELRAIQYRRKKEAELKNKKPSLPEPEPKAKEPEPAPAPVPAPESTRKSQIPLAKPESQIKSKSEKKKNKSDDDKKFSENKRKTLFAKVKPIEKPIEEPIPPTDFSINQTINTKEALSEMQQLWFSKPASPLLNVNPPEKQIGKSILKKDKPSFNLYVDESCLGNFNKNQEEADKPLDLTMKSNSNSDIQVPMDCEKPRIPIPIFKDDDGDENIIKKKSDNEKKLKMHGGKEAEEAFGIVKRSVLKPLDDENKENDVPDDYCGPTGKSDRKTTGILTLAENVPFAPLSDVEEEDDRDDIDGDFSAIIQCNMTGITETINFTKAFQNPRHESTPNPRKSFHNKPDFNESVFVAEQSDKQNPPIRQQTSNAEPRRFSILNENNGLECRKTPPRKDENYKNLSVIAETSREYKSSSSGSSGVSTFALRPSKNFPYTPSELRSTKFSLTSSHIIHQKTKGLSMNGYEASNEYSHTTGFRHAETNEVAITKFISLNETNENQNDMGSVNQMLTNVQLKSEEEIEEIDPFSEEVIEKLLKAVEFPNDNHASNCFAMGDIKVAVPKVGGNLVLGEDSYDVKKMLGEGAYAKIFKIVNEENGEQLIAKYQKPSFPWEFYITREVQTRIRHKKLASLFMNVESAYFFQNASILLTQPVEYGDLLSAINKMKQGQIMCQLIAMYFTVEILTILETLHSCKIIHGDIKPDNFLLMGDTKRPRLQLIDFGRGIDMSLFPENTTFKRVVTTEGFTTIEMQTGKPWTYQIDLYGAANCGHCLLFGDYMKVTQTNGTWNISKKIPRYWAVTEWKNFFTTMLNVESCFNLPDLAELKDSFNTILSDESELDFSMNKLVNLLKNR